MNPNTRVAICCYQGDAHQVVEMIYLYKHHECPITILSPEDSPVLLPGLDCRMGGKRCYIGWDGVERMKAHLRILLTYPENHFLIHDSDSVCLAAELPAELYAEPDVLWSNWIPNNVVAEQPGFPPGIPHVAFQPPWFLSRLTIERLLVPEVKPNNILAFIDYWMVESATRAGIPWRAFPARFSDGISYSPAAAARALGAVRDQGAIFIHSVKGEKHVRPLINAYKEFLK